MNRHRSLTSSRRRWCARLAIAPALLAAVVLSTLAASALAASVLRSSARAQPGSSDSVTAFAADRPSPGSGRGALVSATPLGTRSPAKVRHLLRRFDVADGTVRDPVTAYRLVYRTITPSGAPTRASGLLVLPDPSSPTHAATTAGQPLPLAVYEHGTQSLRLDAPSEPAGESDGWGYGLLLGSSGLAVVAPDYLGLGTGPGLQPYLDAASEASVSVDMLRAARTFVARRHQSLSSHVMVTGFSQGGAAAVALGHALQAGRPGGFTLAALAPVSGPYDLLGAELPAIVRGDTSRELTPFYVSYLLTAWQRRLHLFGSLAAIFRPPYDTRVARLFDGDHDVAPIVAALPHTLAQLLTPDALAQLRHPTGRFRAALQAQAVCRGWRPDVPVHLFAATGDRVVPIANARACAATLRHAGATVTLTSVGAVGHIRGSMLALPRVTAMFDRDAGIRAASRPR